MFHLTVGDGLELRPSEPRRADEFAAHTAGDAERTHLFAIATDTPAAHVPEQPVDPEVARVVNQLDPNPAYVTGETFDVLAWNNSAAELFRGAVTDRARPNLVRWVFLSPDARDVLPDWTEVAQGLLARVRTRAGRQPGRTSFVELEEELRRASPEADQWWPRYDIGTEGAGIKRVRLIDGQVQRLAYTSFDVAEKPGQTMTVYRRL